MTGKPLALLIQPEQSYGMHYVRAYVVIPLPNGELLNAQWSTFGTDAHAARYAGFRLTAYVGGYDDRLDTAGEIWGTSYGYEGVSVDTAAQAIAMAGVLRTVQRGLDRIAQDEGWPGEADRFRVWVVRLARVLRIRTLYVRNLPAARDASGERFRAVSGVALQCWLADVTSYAAAGRYAEVTS